MENYSEIDSIIIIDGKKELKSKLSYCTKNREKILGIINHRFFSLKQKNCIKAEVEKLNINHLIFSLRPSLKKKIAKNLSENLLYDFKKISQLIFLLKIINQKKVKNILIAENYSDILTKKDTKFFLDTKKIKKKIKFLNNIFSKTVSKKNLVFFNSLDINDKKLNNIKIKILKKTKISQNLNSIFDFDQISRKEKNLFWLGFDKEFKDVPWSKKYKYKYKYKEIENGKELFKKLKYCTRCCLPETWEGIKFDKFGICSVCRLSEEKMNINWKKRERILKKILVNNISKNKKNYDGILPISGGKDSTFQAYVLKEIYHFNPLAITHGSNWLSMTGRYNLENCLQKFDLDHLMFIPGRKIINNVAKKSLKKIGDACWHCHIGVGTFPIQTCVEWNLNLIIYGEAPADGDARGTHQKIQKIDIHRFLKESAIFKSKDFVDKKTKNKNLSHWEYPSKKRINSQKINIIHLGQYIFWDEQKNIDLVVKNYGWKNFKVENTFKGYKSNECIMAGVHDYFNFLKRGIGRATAHASEDVRRGLIYREDGFNLAKKYDPQIPHALEYYKKITNYKDKEIEKIIFKSRKQSRYASKLK